MAWYSMVRNGIVLYIRCSSAWCTMAQSHANGTAWYRRHRAEWCTAARCCMYGTAHMAQHSAEHMVWHIMVQHGTVQHVWHGAVHVVRHSTYGTAQYAWCGTPQCHTAQCGTQQCRTDNVAHHGAIWHGTARMAHEGAVCTSWHTTVPYGMVQYVWHSTVRYIWHTTVQDVWCGAAWCHTAWHSMYGTKGCSMHNTELHGMSRRSPRGSHHPAPSLQIFYCSSPAPQAPLEAQPSNGEAAMAASCPTPGPVPAAGSAQTSPKTPVGRGGPR